MCRDIGEALMWSLWYNGHEDQVNAMVEYLEHGERDAYGYLCFPRGSASHCVTSDDVIESRANSILWMCMVQMFGNYGTSPRYGWIERPDEAAAYLRDLRRRTYGYSYLIAEDGTEIPETSDEEYSEMAREWEAEQPTLPEDMMDSWQLYNGEVQDEMLAKHEAIVGRRLTDGEMQEWLMAYARACRMAQDAYAESLTLGTSPMSPRGLTSDPRITRDTNDLDGWDFWESVLEDGDSE